jgi:hypothetical protein
MIQVNIKTIVVQNVECGTSGGVEIVFDRIELVTRLKIPHVIDTVRNYTSAFTETWIDANIPSLVHQFCTTKNMIDIYIKEFDLVDDVLSDILRETLAAWAPGIELIGIRITKPRIPESIRKVFDEAENLRSKYRVLEQSEQSILTKIESERRRDVLDAEKQLSISIMTNERKLLQKNSTIEIAKIEHAIYLAREKEIANARYYAELQEIDSNKRILTPQYLNYQRILMMNQNTRYYLGSSIPSSKGCVYTIYFV